MDGIILTAFFKDGLLIEDSRTMAEHYGRSRQFIVDIFSIIPGEILLYRHFPDPIFLRFNRLIRMGRMMEFFNRIERWVKRPLLFRITRLFLYLSMIIHWNACTYIKISSWIGFGEDRWVYFDIHDQRYPENGTFCRMYTYAAYWSTLTLSTIGELSEPEKNCEFVFMIVNFMVGIFIFATIVGHVNDMVNSLAEEHESFRSQLDGVKFYMQVPMSG